MHALHHLDRRPTLIATMLAAALAIIVTLVLATSLSDLNPGSRPDNSRASATLQRSHAARTAPTSSLFTRDPFARPLGAPIRLPWASADRSAPAAR